MEDQIVVFLDLLGFREQMVRSGADPVQAGALLAEYDAVMTDALQRLQGDHGFFHYRGFTDNFVISTPLRGRLHPEERFGLVMSSVADFQLYLATKGWFVRGGIAVGPFFMDDRIVYGPALIEAYELEHSTAREPRIVLSEAARNHMRSFLEFYAFKEDAPQNSDILIDQDGYAFVNYLASAYLPEAPEICIDALRQHRSRIEDALAANRRRPGVWNKYRWVAEYHNFFAQEWYPNAADDLMISAEVLRPQPEYLVNTELPPNFPVPWMNGGG